MKEPLEMQRRKIPPGQMLCGKDNSAGKDWSEKDSTDESWRRNTHHRVDNTGGCGKDNAEVGTACYNSLMQRNHNIAALFQKENL